MSRRFSPRCVERLLSVIGDINPSLSPVIPVVYLRCVHWQVGAVQRPNSPILTEFARSMSMIIVSACRFYLVMSHLKKMLGNLQNAAITKKYAVMGAMNNGGNSAGFCCQVPANPARPCKGTGLNVRSLRLLTQPLLPVHDCHLQLYILNRYGGISPKQS